MSPVTRKFAVRSSAELRGDSRLETFEGRLKPRRVRLTAEERRWLTYVLCDWDADGGNSSSMGAELERLAQDPTKLPEWRHMIRRERIERGDYGAEYMYVPSVASSPASRMLPAETYCTKSAVERGKIHHAWRALQRVLAVHVPSAVVLYALYGDMPPGLPAGGMWPADVDSEYRRVARLTDSSGGSTFELEAAVRVDNAGKPGETEAARKARIEAAKVQRVAKLGDVGREAEGLIVRAANEYRGAWEVVA